MSRIAIVQAYVLPGALMVLTGPLAWSMGDGPVDIARKMCLAPMFLLAMRGLRTFFPEVKDRTRSLPTHLEFQFLVSGLTAINIVLLATPANDEVFWQMVRIVVLTTVVMTAVNMALFWHERRTHPKQDDAGPNLTNL
ncbi:hypothetical protein C8J34_101111 [Rhizobium sp. PP-F2F-G36]|nr:hypothetical protein C8J34_101111 [Rhizobium sp. PP-F2F-G36]